ncbi:MAG: dTDP-4-dehydrorhamnose 3,5-epimerase family protein [Planctomycetota bacterium]|jgi:dTDP-4-dehydrorhamnose 3,5-epimerase
MTKKIAKLTTVLFDEGLLIRSSGDLIDGVAAKRAKVIPDERGRLGEIFRADDPWYEKFGQVYFTTTYPDVVKAWHYHKTQTDYFYVVKGTVKIALYDQRDNSPTTGVVNELYLGEHCPGLLRIPAGVLHGWMCVSQSEAYIVNTPSEVYCHENPDEFRVNPHDNDIPYEWKRNDG